jgi:hypothetical protein
MENVMIISPHSQLRSAQALAAYWFMQAAQAGLDEAQYQISRMEPKMFPDATSSSSICFGGKWCL